jgi:hypothetical protein
MRHITETPEFICPRCRAHLNRTSGPDEVAPSPGDITVCLHCGMICMFDINMQLTRAPDEAITVEALLLSMMYYRPVFINILPEDGKVH